MSNNRQAVYDQLQYGVTTAIKDKANKSGWTMREGSTLHLARGLRQPALDNTTVTLFEKEYKQFWVWPDGFLLGNEEFIEDLCREEEPCRSTFIPLAALWRP